MTEDNTATDTEAEAPDCGRYICFFDIGLGRSEEEDRYPVGIGKTRNEAMSEGIKNVLPSIGGDPTLAYNSGFVVVAQPNLTDDELQDVGRVISDFFHSKSELASANIERPEGGAGEAS